MSVEFRRNLIVMTVIHLVVVLAIFFVGLFRHLFQSPATREITTYVSIADPLPSIPSRSPLPLRPEPVVRPEPEPELEPELEPEPPPPKLKSSSEIRKSTKKVTRDPKRVTRPSVVKPPSSREISQELASLKKPPQSKRKKDLPTSYYAHVRQVMYGSWSDEKPARNTVNPGTVATMSITVNRQGRILTSRLMKPSGSPVLDASAERAVRKVTTLKPLPDSFRGRTKVITIDFELTG